MTKPDKEDDRTEKVKKFCQNFESNTNVKHAAQIAAISRRKKRRHNNILKTIEQPAVASRKRRTTVHSTFLTLQEQQGDNTIVEKNP